MRREHLVVLGILLLVAVLAGVGLALGGELPAGRAGGDVVGIVYVEGGIVGGRSQEGLFGVAVGSDDIIAQLREALDDPAVKAVVLRLNTPGGSAAASQEIGAEIQRLREAGKVVVASMGDVAASGGYWIAATTDRIVASPATITGSIGVITQVASYAGLYQKLGIEVQTIKSGEFKDMGDPSRTLTDEERALLQAMVNDIFDQFVDVVAEGRGLTRDRVLAVADGRVFTGRQALNIGLVDELGTLQDAIERAAEMAGIADSYTVRELGQRPFWEQLLSRLGGLRGFVAPAAAPWGDPGWMRWILTPSQGR